ncbi:hypothetical protein Btru_027849 [Bulinus truncatus]|nr:hypothetical protein Btru_027849 [Bulinus truncatus]
MPASSSNTDYLGIDHYDYLQHVDDPDSPDTKNEMTDDDTNDQGKVATSGSNIALYNTSNYSTNQTCPKVTGTLNPNDYNALLNTSEPENSYYAIKPEELKKLDTKTITVAVIEEQ